MSYKKLHIRVLAREVVIEVHKMSLKLPKFEMFEEGQQIRRSGKTTKATLLKDMAGDAINRIGSNSLFMHCHLMTKQWIT